MLHASRAPLTILVLGSEGFIGSHVRKRLLAAGHRVVGVDSLEPRVHQNGKRAATGTIVCDYAETPDEVLAQADVAIHLAAQVGVADSMADPARYLGQNTLGTARFLERLGRQARRFQRLVVASSMSIYGEGTGSDTVPVTEESPVRPASVYGLTKYDQERLCLMFGATAGISAVALRFFNVYGPGQALTNPYTGVIANFANWLLRDEAPLVYEDGLQTRDFIHVDDVADAVVRCALSPVLSHHVYNVCTGVPTTILTVAEQLAAALQKPVGPHVTGETRPGDIRHCVGDNQRLKAEFPHWSPRGFADGIREYTAWLRSHALQGAPAR